jgi:hypothetical protein
MITLSGVSGSTTVLAVINAVRSGFSTLRTLDADRHGGVTMPLRLSTGPVKAVAGSDLLVTPG